MKSKTAKGVRFEGEMYRKVIVEYGLNKIGDQTSYFSVTVQGWTSLRRDPDVAGAGHELALKAFPSLKPLVALHLSDKDGVPLHAEANGWYWLREAKESALPGDWVGKGLTREQMAETYLRAPAGYFDGVTDRADFADRVDKLRPVWLAEAQAAIQRFELLGPPDVIISQS